MSGLDDLRTFVEVVERGSFRAAARSLGVTPPAISKRIQALEHRVAAQLLRRSTRRIELTEAGRLFYERVAPIPAQVEEAEDRVRELSEAPRGHLRVAMPISFAGAGLQYELIGDFMARYPEVHLDVRIVGDPLSSLGGGFDVVVASRYPGRRFPDTSFRGRQLVDLQVAAYAAPTYLEARGRPRHPKDLAEHDCLSAPGREWYFTDPKKKGRALFVQTTGTLTTDSNALLWAATLQGRGVAYAHPHFFEEALRDGRVEPVLERFTKGAHVEVFVFHPPGRYVPRRTRAFMDALSAQFTP